MCVYNKPILGLHFKNLLKFVVSKLPIIQATETPGNTSREHTFGGA